MGKQVDMNKPLSAEDKKYLTERGRGYLIAANERRFGVDGTKTPEPGEEAGNHAISPFYNQAEREAAVYDKGGAPLPGTTLDYDTGRVADRVNGKRVEYTGPGHTPGAFDLTPQRDAEYGGFGSYEVDEQGNPVDDHMDDDIVEYVTGLQNIDALLADLKELEVDANKKEGREALENKLAVKLQDLRDSGEDVTFTSEDDESDNAGNDSENKDEEPVKTEDVSETK